MINIKTEDTMFLTSLLNNKNLIIGFLLIAAVLGAYGYIRILKSENSVLIAEKETLQNLLDTSQANVSQLQNDIRAQNNAIANLKKDGDARIAKGAADVKQAQETAADYKRRADELLARESPQNVPRCDAANALINEELQHVRK